MKSGIFVGLNKGFIVHKPSTNSRKLKPSYRKGRLGKSSPGTLLIGKRTKQIREIVREIVGYSSYEKRAIELIRTGTGAAAKKALKLVKKRLGTMRRAKAKRNDLENVIQAMRHVAEQREEQPKKEEGKKA